MLPGLPVMVSVSELDVEMMLMGADIDIISTSAIHQVCFHGLLGEKDCQRLNRVPSMSTSRSRSITRRIRVCQKKLSIQIHEAEALRTIILQLSIQIQGKLEHETDKTQGYPTTHRHSKTQTKRKGDGEVGKATQLSPVSLHRPRFGHHS
jgi:hypothetical protein